MLDVRLIKENDKLYLRWQIPVDKITEYSQIIAKCASVLKCNEDEVLDRVCKLIEKANCLRHANGETNT